MLDGKKKYIDRYFTYISFLHTNDSTPTTSPIFYESEFESDTDALP